MSSPTLVCIVPNPSIDKTAEVDRLETGSIHRPPAVVAVPGGKGLNVARSAQSLGLAVEAVVLLAGHAGRWIDDELRRLSLDHVVAWADGETRSCLSVLDRATGRLTEFYEAGDGVSAAAWGDYVDRIRAAVEAKPQGTLVALSGSLPAGAPADAAPTIVGIARAAGSVVLVDTSGPQLAGALAAEPDVVKVNTDEASGLLGMAIGTEGDAATAARALGERGAARAIVTRGRDGAVGWDGRTAWAVEAAESGGPYSVGSGDAFLAGFAAGLAEDQSFDACLRRAAAAGTASTLVAGQGRLDRSAADRLLASTTVHRLD